MYKELQVNQSKVSKAQSANPYKGFKVQAANPYKGFKARVVKMVLTDNKELKEFKELLEKPLHKELKGFKELQVKTVLMDSKELKESKALQVKTVRTVKTVLTVNKELKESKVLLAPKSQPNPSQCSSRCKVEHKSTMTCSFNHNNNNKLCQL